MVEAARDGDPEAWTVLVERFQDFAVAMALGSSGDWDGARDAAQGAFALALARISELRDPAAFPGWFSTLVCTSGSRRIRKAPAPTFALLSDRMPRATRAQSRSLLARYLELDPQLKLPAPETLSIAPIAPIAATAQRLLRYLAQPFTIYEPFSSVPGESTLPRDARNRASHARLCGARQRRDLPRCAGRVPA